MRPPTWFTEVGLTSGPIFVWVTGSELLGEALSAQTVAAVFRKIGRWSGLPDEEWQRISGHSVRVGAAQDLLALNIDLASVMQTGRWKDTRMPMRYGEKVLARGGGMARAAKEQGRA
jgi:integrase/recombinase XerD